MIGGERRKKDSRGVMNERIRRLKWAERRS